MKFEAFGSSPEFTTPIQNFMFENCSKLEIAKQSGEQSLNNYSLFQKYSELMDKTLNLFLEDEKLSPDKFILACQFAKEENLPCSFLDYVLSSMEYEDFYNLMLDYKLMGEKDLNDNKDDFFMEDDKKEKDKVQKKKK
jgi:hypothetical protein